jgi:glycosyltransferase involved in cell wall biosynthesis
MGIVTVGPWQAALLRIARDVWKSSGGTVNKIDTPRKLRVQIVSTYKTSCGIAAFTETIESHLRNRLAITVGRLDQDLLKSTDPTIEAAGDALIAKIAEQGATADVVNLQWEPGLLGATPGQILRRFRMLLRSNPNLVVTVHTVVPEPKFSSGEFVRRLLRGKARSAMEYAVQAMRPYGRETYRLLKEAERTANLTLVVHTRREKQLFAQVRGHKKVFDHPLSYIRQGWWENLENDAAEIKARLKRQFGKDKVFIGFFGFLTEYKGISTAIEAMRFLPENYVLLLYGGVHPSLVQDRQLVSPYVKELMSRIDRSKEDNLSRRVWFMGAPDDYQFAASMKACDVNVFPYMEIGQSASGPVAQSIEMGKRTVVSNNKMFGQLATYFPDRMAMADIGNYIHLAHCIEDVMIRDEPGRNDLRYDCRTLADFYYYTYLNASGKDVVDAISSPGHIG